MAKTNLVPIQVILNRRPDGGIAWPDFNQVESSLRNDQPWSKFIDSAGIGWHYDKVNNLGTGADNGCASTLVPQAFAEAAVLLFPSIVSIVDEATFEKFYNDKANAHMPIEFLDTDILQGITARVKLETDGVAPAPSAEILAARAKCLDPTEQEYRGIRKNMKKKWTDARDALNVTIHPDQSSS